MVGKIKTGAPSPSSDFWQATVKEKFNRVEKRNFLQRSLLSLS
jgi:hypothetical protein